MENVAELLRFVLVASGLIYIVTRSLIFRPIRMWLGHTHILLTALVYCPSCSGFWIGLALTPLWPWFGVHPWWHTAFQAAVSICGLGGVLGPLWDDTLVQTELDTFKAALDDGDNDGSSKEG